MPSFNLQNLLSLHRLFLVYIIIIIMIVSTLSLTNVLERADLFLLDRAFQWRGEQEPREEIAIVAISQRDFELGAPRWPWPRSLMARLVDEISVLEPAVIVIDILYTEPTSSETHDRGCELPGRRVPQSTRRHRCYPSGGGVKGLVRPLTC